MKPGNHCRPCREQPCRCGAGCAETRGGYLLPRIMASGREWLRCCRTELQVEGVCGAHPPLRLVSVSVAGEPVCTQTPDPSRHLLCLQVMIPLMCQVEDSCGRMHCGRACIRVDTAIRPAVPLAECWRDQIIAVPCVRLVQSGCAGADGCFDAQLEIHLTCWLVRWEPVCAPMQMECPPPLPLYPQPRC